MKITPFKNGKLFAEVSLSGGNFMLMKGFPGYSKWHGRKLAFRPSANNIKHILEHWPDAVWEDGEALDAFNKYCEMEIEGENFREEKHIEITDDGSYEYKRPPMDHQRQAFLLTRDKPIFGFFMEQGTGKTKVILDSVCYLFEKKEVECLIVIAWPNGVHRNWCDNELHEDIPERIKYVDAWWSPNLTKKKVKTYNAVMNAPENVLKIFTFNVEAFKSQKAKDQIEALLKKFKCMLVIDQSASIKNSQSKRTQYIINHCRTLAKYRRILDGQPVAEGAEELYSQFYFLDPLILNHDTLTAYKAEFCKMGRFNNIIGYRNTKELHKRIDGFSYRVLEKDCMDLPPRRYMRWHFELSKEERRIYDEMNEKKLAHFNEDEKENPLVVDLALVKNLRLQQITSGWWPQKDNFKPIEKVPSRWLAMETLLKTFNGKVLIFSRFRADLELLQEKLGDKAVSYHGGINENDRALAKKKFQEDPNTTYFIGQQRNAGIGHTLTAAKYVVFYNNDPSLRFREESEKRAHRKGIEKTLGNKKLQIWDIIAEKTQDKKVINSLRMKKDVSTVILQDPESFFLIEDDE